MEKLKMHDLLLKYITDKNHGSIKNIYNNLDDRIVCDNPEPFIGHTYGNAYDEIFGMFDRNSNINFLEIGIQRGGSLLATRDYFKNANIYGVDIKDSILPEYKREDFNYIISDIKDPSVTEKLRDVNFDIIIDDGSHMLHDVLFVVSNYLSKLNTNGVLVIEDCQNPDHWLNEVRRISPNGYEVTTKDLRGDTPHSSYDNFLIIIKKIK
jgi:23S rRNA U2552 (ribose-2'-O)-methylase RlmE/FtsJ